jgi:hypothetical protein
VNFCLKVSLSALAAKMVVAARVKRQGGQPGETASSCFDKQATWNCQEPSSWVKTLTAPSVSCTYRKKGFILSGRPRAGTFVSALLIFVQGLLFFVSLSILWVPTFPLWLNKGVLPRESNWGSRSSRNLQILETL